jgi:Amt family ammonium transporter
LGGVGITDYLAVDSSVGTAEYAAAMQITAQVVAIFVTVVWTCAVSFIALTVCKYTTGLKVTDQEEREGLDIAAHGERAYN